MVELYHLEVKLTNPQNVLIAEFTTSDIELKRMNLLFNDFVKKIVEESSSAWTQSLDSTPIKVKKDG